MGKPVRTGQARPSAAPTSAKPRWSEENMLAAILESAAQSILSIDSQGRIVLANPRTESMFGYNRDELIGHAVELLLPQSARAAHVRHRAEYVENPHVRPMGIGLDLMGQRKDGGEFPVEISLSYVREADELFAIAFITDITERKRMEDQLIQSQKLEAVGRLAGGVAHDFNNMLTIISGYNRMMLQQLTAVDPLRGFAEEILKATDRAAALTNQLLSFSRRQMTQPRILDINAILRETQKMLGRLIGEDIQLTIELDPDLGTVRADPGQIEQVIFNLAANARNAMEAGGQLVIETENVMLGRDYARTHLGVEPGPYVMIAVSDTGSGMDTETRRHIFEPFFTTKESGKGTGLGLATVYGIVKQNGGDIWVYSERGKGTSFKIYLPRVAGDAEAAQPPNTAVAPGTETILLVEDEEGVRRLLRYMLVQLGYKVLEAESGGEALEVSERHRGDIHLLITDVVLPHMSGKQIAQALISVRPSLKAMFISGYTENAIAHHGVIDADVHFLSKPFTAEALAAKIREALDTAGK